MKAQNLDSPTIRVIQNPEAAALLTNPQGQRFLSPFLAKEATVSDAAKELGMTANSLLYRVNQMVRLELLHIVREEVRPGRAVKIYRSSADMFYVPFELTPAETLEALFMPMNSHWQTLFVRNAVVMLADTSPKLGLQLWRGETGELYAKPASEPGKLLDFKNPDMPPMLAFWSAALHLDDEDARALQRELIEVYERYAQLKGKKRYVTHLAMAPWVLGEAPI